MTRLRTLAAAVALALSFGGPALAAGTTDTTLQETGPFYEGQKAVERGDWQEAISLFSTATSEEPRNADAWNMLAYSYRMSGDIENAFANYQTALAIDPDHKDAHEYIGEAYLQVGDLMGAQKHLEALDDICWLGCSQYDELEAAIAAWKAENG